MDVKAFLKGLGAMGFWLFFWTGLGLTFLLILVGGGVVFFSGHPVPPYIEFVGFPLTLAFILLLWYGGIRTWRKSLENALGVMVLIGVAGMIAVPVLVTLAVPILGDIKAGVIGNRERNTVVCDVDDGLLLSPRGNPLGITVTYRIRFPVDTPGPPAGLSRRPLTGLL